MLHLKFLLYLAYLSHFVYFAFILKSPYLRASESAAASVWSFRSWLPRPVEPCWSNLTCLCGRHPPAVVSSVQLICCVVIVVASVALSARPS